MQKEVTLNQKGFSLIEVLIYAGLTAIVVALLGGILITSLRIQDNQSSSIDVTKELIFLVGTMKRTVYSAQRLEVQNNGSLLRLFFTDGYTRDFLWDSEVSKQIMFNELPPGGGGSATRLSSNNIRIDSLHFTNLSNGSSSAVQIFITATASTTKPGGGVSKTIETTAALMVQAQ